MPPFRITVTSGNSRARRCTNHGLSGGTVLFWEALRPSRRHLRACTTTWSAPAPCMWLTKETRSS
eukprot:scaffold1667_cov258-Pinguiococcus_pyrenoidosus.AAC.21